GSDHTGLYDIRPIYLKVNEPKSAVSRINSRGGPRVTIVAKLSLETVHPILGSNAPLHYSFLATRHRCRGDHIALTSSKELDCRSQRVAVPLDPSKPVGLNATIVITEIDQGYDKKILDAIVGGSESVTSEVVDIVKGAFED